jgi:ABC-type polysaccharide/polyol phosphate transport system ATPase subunit
MPRVPGLNRILRIDRGGAGIERAVDDELQFHFDMTMRDLVNSGLTPDEARREAPRRFGDVQALAGVDLTVAQGEFFGLLGPNGAGKTTLISILAGLTRADRGTARVLGHDVVIGYRQSRRALGVVP